MRLRRYLGVAVATAVIVGGAFEIAGVATAGPPPPTFSACVAHATGSLYGTTTNGTPTCFPHDSVISWNEQGPPGMNGSSIVTSAGAPTGACTTGNTDVDLGNGEVFTCTASAWVDTGSSIKGPKGDSGAPGPSSLTVLQGSACTFDSHPSTVNVSISSITGAVSIVCAPVYSVSVTFTSGTAEITLADLTNSTFDRICSIASSCSTLMASGDTFRVELLGNEAYTATCPDGSVTSGPSPDFAATCPAKTLNGTLTGDYNVTVTPS